MFRLFKIGKYLKSFILIKNFFKRLNSNFEVSKLFTFFLTTIILSHLFACLWVLLPKFLSEEEYWVVKSGLQDETVFRLYLYSLYYSFTTLFTLGFGDITSVNELEKFMSTLWMIFGIGFYSFTIGTLSSVLAELDSKENKLKYKLSILNDFNQEANLTPELKEKIKRVLVYNSGKLMFSLEEKQLMFNELPLSLKVDVSF